MVHSYMHCTAEMKSSQRLKAPFAHQTVYIDVGNSHKNCGSSALAFEKSIEKTLPPFHTYLDMSPIMLVEELFVVRLHSK